MRSRHRHRGQSSLLATRPWHRFHRKGHFTNVCKHLVATASMAVGFGLLTAAPASADNIGNSCATATPIANGQTLRATIDPESGQSLDTDYYAFQIPVGARYWVTVDLTEVPKDYDLYLDANSNGTYETISKNRGTSPERVEALMYGQSTPYCFAVENYTDFDRVAKYAVTLTFKDVPPDNGPDAANLAAPLSPGVPVVETAEDNADEDWYTFSIGTASDVALDLTSPTADNDLYLYRPTSWSSDFSSRNSGNSPDRIAERLDAGTYYVKVIGAGDLWTAYQLSLAVSPVPTPPATPSLAVRTKKKTYVVFWTPVAGATGYEVKKGKRSWSTTGNTWVTVPKRAAKRRAYVVKVRAVNSAGKGASATKVL